MLECAIFPDTYGVVRTVSVKMRPRDSREKVLPGPPYLRYKDPVIMTVGVQRLVVLLPIEEQCNEKDQYLPSDTDLVKVSENNVGKINNSVNCVHLYI